VVLRFYVFLMRWRICMKFTKKILWIFFHFSNIFSLKFSKILKSLERCGFEVLCFTYALAHMHLKFYKLLFCRFFSFFKHFFFGFFPTFWKVSSYLVFMFSTCVGAYAFEVLQTSFLHIFFIFKHFFFGFFQHFGRSQAMWFSSFPYALVHMHLKFYKFLF
jgi:hypothetical protein